ncbi:hypothetical protein NUACC21_38120 [Scytonema sp. NUACC21]
MLDPNLNLYQNQNIPDNEYVTLIKIRVWVAIAMPKILKLEQHDCLEELSKLYRQALIPNRTHAIPNNMVVG